MLNKVELIGRVGQPPDSRFMPNGNQVVNLSLATNRSWKNKDSGEKVEETEWHRVVMFGKLAGITAEYVTQGRLIRVAGRLKTRKWQKDGADHYSTEVIADEMLMLGSRAEDQGRSAIQYSAPPPPPASTDGFDDDVPF